MGNASLSVSASLLAVEKRLKALFEAVDPEVFDMAAAPFSLLGKAARARFTLLTGDALGLERPKAEHAAVCAELVHAASLMHDDCIDEAALRRGKPTLNARLGINAAILVGDLTVSMAMDSARLVSPDAPFELVAAVRRMTEGALLEENSRGRRITRERLERIITLKTGALFRWCALTACSLAGRPELLADCGRIGDLTGLSFQLVDDVLDLEAAAGEAGKAPLRDLASGRMTMPLIMTLEDSACAGRAEALLERLRGFPEDLSAVTELARLIRGSGNSAKAREHARACVDSILPLTEKLPVKEAASELRVFVKSLSERLA